MYEINVPTIYSKYRFVSVHSIYNAYSLKNMTANIFYQCTCDASTEFRQRPLQVLLYHAIGRKGRRCLPPKRDIVKICQCVSTSYKSEIFTNRGYQLDDFINKMI